MRDENALQHRRPGHVDCQERREVGKQRQRQPLQYADITAMIENDLRDRTQYSEEHDPHPTRGLRKQQTSRGGHRTEVGADVESVGDEEQCDGRLQHPPGVMLAQVPGEAAPRGTADTGADALDRHHQGVREEERPPERVSEGGPRLRVGADSARIVVGGSGDEPRPEQAPKSDLTSPPAARCSRHRVLPEPLPCHPVLRRPRTNMAIAPMRKRMNRTLAMAAAAVARTTNPSTPAMIAMMRNR